MRESVVEKQFVEAVRAAGGQALKFTSQTMNGVPDRLVLLLGGKCAFVELKAPGKHADSSVPDSPEEWLDAFSTFSIYQVLPEIIKLWGLNLETQVKEKNHLAQLTGK